MLSPLPCCCPLVDKIAPAIKARFIGAFASGVIVVAAASADGTDQSSPARERNTVDAPSWSRNVVEQRARELAKEPFSPSPELPPALERLNYDTYRLIAFEHAEAIWKQTDSPFWLECFHRGYLFRDKVEINLIEDGVAAPLKFNRKLFQYRGEVADLNVPDDVGFAGFRVLGKFENSPHFLELASFLGASYFRAIAEGQFYGTSARGLAIDIGMAKPEEFPRFREFWIERPTADAKSLRFWALLDSPSVTGAYEFTLHPGEGTTFHIKARLFFRQTPKKLGLAPLTSMWMWGDGRAAPANDPRPKVHDADGLLVHTTKGQWIWRPLARQSYPSVSHYDFAGVRGFGLLQRDRDPEHFCDDEAKYHLRPSVWIEPKQGWSEGAVELLELPAEHEGVDNIAAWWVPRKAVQAGDTLDLEYTVSFLAAQPSQHTEARAIATQVQKNNEKSMRLEVDFRSERLAALASTSPVTPEVSAQRGTVGDVRCEKRPDRTWRLTFSVTPSGEGPVELEARLKHEGDVLTETWRYLCPN